MSTGSHNEAHNGQPNDIESVMIDGQCVMRDRKITTVDEAAIGLAARKP